MRRVDDLRRVKASRLSFPVGLLVTALMAAGCGPGGHDHDHDHAHGDGHAHGHGHEHVPPHGGVPVILGDEAYHLEFVHEPDAGRLKCYVLDSHMEDFIRIDQPAMALRVDQNGESRTVMLKAMADSATGERVGNTSMFAVEGDWLKTDGLAFQGVIMEVEIRGTTFENVQFSYGTADK